MVNFFRKLISDLIAKIQIIWMEQYGYFGDDYIYVATKNIPNWVNFAHRQLGYFAFNLDPRRDKAIENKF